MADPLDLYEPAPVSAGMLKQYQPVGPDPGSWVPAFARGVVRGAAPSGAGIVGFGAGVEAGAAAGLPLDPLTFGGASVVGGLVGGLIGSSVASAGAEKAQSTVADAVTDGGYSQSQAQDDAAHPYAGIAAGVATQLPFMRPSLSLNLLGRSAGAVFGGGVEAGHEYADTGHIDLGRVGAQAAAGALLDSETGLTKGIQRGIGLTAARAGANATIASGLRDVSNSGEAIHSAAMSALDPNLSPQTRSDLVSSRALTAALGDRRTPAEIAATNVVEGDAHVEATTPPLTSIGTHGAAVADATQAMLQGRAPAISSLPPDRDGIIRFVLNDLEGGSKVVHYGAADGGTTKFGIAAADNLGVDVANLSEGQAAAIARTKYWFPELDQADPRTAAVAFDAGYISGPKFGKQLLEASGGDADRALELYRAHLDHIADTVPGKAKYREGWNNRVDKLAAKIGEAGDAPPAQALASNDIAGVDQPAGADQVPPEDPTSPAPAQAPGEIEGSEPPTLASFLPREEFPEVHQRLDDATERVRQAQAAVSLAEQTVKSRTISDTVALVDPETAPLVQSYEQDRDAPGATRAQREAAEHQIDVITQNIGEDTLRKAEADYQIGLKKRVGSERDSLKAAKRGLSFAQADFDLQATRARNEAVGYVPDVSPASAGTARTRFADLAQPPVVEGDGGFRAEPSPFGGFHAVDESGNRLVPEDHVPGEPAPRFKTAADALKAAPDLAPEPKVEPGTTNDPRDGEKMLEHFSQPGGDGAIAQTDSLEHDVRMALDANPDLAVRLGEKDVSVAAVLKDLDDERQGVEALRACAAPVKGEA